MNYEKAGEILKSFLDQEQLRKGSRYAAFFRSWERIAGDKIAAHTRITDIRGNQLLVEADHPGWVQMIQMQRELILQRTARLFPELAINSMLIKLRRKDREETEGSDEPEEAAGTDARDDAEDQEAGQETRRTAGGEPAAGPEDTGRPGGTESTEREPDGAPEGTPLERIQDRQLRNLLERLERGIRDRDPRS